MYHVHDVLKNLFEERLLVSISTVDTDVTNNDIDSMDENIVAVSSTDQQSTSRIERYDEGELDNEDKRMQRELAESLLKSCNKQNYVKCLEENMRNPDWRYRDASLVALDLLSADIKSNTLMLEFLFKTMLPSVIELMHDSSTVVRCTAILTVGRIFKFGSFTQSIINEANLSTLVLELSNGLTDKPRLVASVCWTLSRLANASIRPAGMYPIQLLSTKFDLLIRKLWRTTNRRYDARNVHLYFASHGALLIMIINSPQDCSATALQMTMIVLERVCTLSTLRGFEYLQLLLCQALQTVSKNITLYAASTLAARIMPALPHFYSLFERPGHRRFKLMLFFVLNVLIKALGPRFSNHVGLLKSFLFPILRNHSQFHVCLSAHSLIQDLCSKVEENMLPFCDEIMALALENLGTDTLHRSMKVVNERALKAELFAILGNVVYIIGAERMIYSNLNAIFSALVQASQIQVDINDVDKMLYLKALRRGILWVNERIVASIRRRITLMIVNPNLLLIIAQIPFMLQSIRPFVNEDREYRFIYKAVRLVSELCRKCPAEIVLHNLEIDVIVDLTTQACRSNDRQMKRIGERAMKNLCDIGFEIPEIIPPAIISN